MKTEFRQSNCILGKHELILLDTSSYLGTPKSAIYTKRRIPLCTTFHGYVVNFLRYLVPYNSILILEGHREDERGEIGQLYAVDGHDNAYNIKPKHIKIILQQQLVFFLIFCFYFSYTSTSSKFSKPQCFPCTSSEKLTELQTIVSAFFPATDKYIYELPTLASFKNRVLLPPFDFNGRHINSFENRENLAFNC